MSIGGQWEAEPEPGPVYRSSGGANPALIILAVFNFLLAAVELFYCGRGVIGGAAAFGIVQEVGAQAEQQIPANAQFPDGGAKAKVQVKQVAGMMSALVGIVVVVCLIGVIVAVLRILAGIGILNRANWGRVLNIVLASITILYILLVLLSLGQSVAALNVILLVAYLAYVIASFVILLSGRNAAEFRRGGAV